jgi:elongation of very long chain fatty acids protein 7
VLLKLLTLKSQNFEMEFIDNFTGFYHIILEIYGDSRVKNWLGMSSPLPTVGVSLVYVFVVKVNNNFSVSINEFQDKVFLLFQYLGPYLMRNRKPFKLRKTIIVYNLLQVLLSLKLFYNFSVYAWLTTGDHAYNWRCQKIDLASIGFPLLVRQFQLKLSD